MTYYSIKKQLQKYMATVRRQKRTAARQSLDYSVFSDLCHLFIALVKIVEYLGK